MKVLDHGSVFLVECSGDELDIVNAARVSYGKESDEMTDRDRGLIRYLKRNHHDTPFEMVWTKWRVKAPIFVMREWHRHRTASINEISGRYTELQPEFYIPEMVRKQVGKQGDYRYEEMDSVASAYLKNCIREHSEIAFAHYRYLLEAGAAKEHARLVLPVNTYSEMIWACNLRNLMHFFDLRCAEDAQWEIRKYALKMRGMMKSMFPTVFEACE